MPDFSILLGSPRLDIAAAGGPSVKKRPPDDDPDAIRRIQRALVELGFPFPKSFPGGASGEPDGLFGPEPLNAETGSASAEGTVVQYTALTVVDGHLKTKNHK